MKGRTKRVIAGALVLALLAAAPFAFRAFREWSKMREENALEALVIDSLEIKDATFDEALRVVADKVRALGHPELQLHIYENGREVPYFHARLDGYGFTPESKTNLKIIPDGKNGILIDNGGSASGMPVTLHDVLWCISLRFQLPCALHGHDLVAAHTPGTLQRYRKTTIRLADYFWEDSDEAIAKLVRENGFGRYEGMKIQFRREEKDVEFVGPRDEYDLFESDLRPHPDSRWEEMKVAVWNWWFRFRFGL